MIPQEASAEPDRPRLAPAGGAPVVVAGAGPAGCAAAIALRRGGRRVLLLDRAAFPRDKVCGDVLLPAALGQLGRLGLDPKPLEGLASRCDGVRYASPSGRAFSAPFRDPLGREASWLVVRRLVFDAWLLERAREAGAEVRQGLEVVRVVRGEGGEARGVEARRRGGGATERIAAAAVVGADGAASAVARSLGAGGRDGAHLAVGLRGYATGLGAECGIAEVYTLAGALPGCAWILPAGPGDGVWNVGAGMLLSDARRRGPDPARLMETFRAGAPSLARRLGDAAVGTMRGWTLPLASSPGPFSGDGWLLAGDAAGLVDPLTGHGIHNALESGRLAGETLAAALDAGDVGRDRLAIYEARLRDGILREARLGLWVRRLHRRPLLAEAMAMAGARSAGFRGLLAGLMGHTMPRRDLGAPRKLLAQLSAGGGREVAA